MDNLTAIAYINRMGGTHSPECNHVSRHIWEWAIARDIWLSAAYIPGDSNVVADFHSSCFHENKEWALKKRFLPSLNTPMACPGLTCLHHRHMQKYQYIFPGYQTQMPLRWMPLLSPGRI